MQRSAGNNSRSSSYRPRRLKRAATIPTTAFWKAWAHPPACELTRASEHPSAFATSKCVDKFAGFRATGGLKTNRRRPKRTTFSAVRWSSYAIAAGATTASGIPTAEAEIHYSGPLNFKFNRHRPGISTHGFPIAQGVYLGGFRYVRGSVDNSAGLYLSGAAVSSGFRSVPSFATSIAASLARGELVSAGPFNHFATGRLQDYACEFPGFQEPGTYAVGFRFNNGAGSQYGWVRIKWGGCSANQFILKDYAFGDPGDRVRVGQTQLGETEVAPQAAKGADAAAIGISVETDATLAPAEGSLGLLALGAVGLLAWRKCRRTQ